MAKTKPPPPQNYNLQSQHPAVIGHVHIFLRHFSLTHSYLCTLYSWLWYHYGSYPVLYDCDFYLPSLLSTFFIYCTPCNIITLGSLTGWLWYQGDIYTHHRHQDLWVRCHPLWTFLPHTIQHYSFLHVLLLTEDLVTVVTFARLVWQLWWQKSKYSDLVLGLPTRCIFSFHSATIAVIYLCDNREWAGSYLTEHGLVPLTL